MNYLTFCFDDGYKSWLNAGKLLEKHGWRGTFYTCLRNVVSKRKATRTRMFPEDDVITWGELKKLKEAGHEIASHGVRHIDLNLCNQQELEMEIVGSLKLFKSRGFTVTTYGCAFNTYPKEAQELALKHYKTFRNWVGVNKVPIRTRVYKVLRAGDAYNEASKGDNKWVVSTWHDIKDTNFKKYLDKVEKLGVEVKIVRWMYANASR